MLFLVDGYNVTMTDPATASCDKEQQRDALIRRLATRSKTLLGTGEVVVVFDARGQLGRSSEKTAGVRVVFAPDADSEIVRRCLAARGQVTVVTSDKRLTARISQDVGRHVVYRESSACFEGAQPASRRAAVGRKRPTDEDRPPHADDITRELEDIWLQGETEEKRTE